jgi:hypothetical protein
MSSLGAKLILPYIRDGFGCQCLYKFIVAVVGEALFLSSVLP